MNKNCISNIYLRRIVAFASNCSYFCAIIYGQYFHGFHDEQSLR